MATADPNGGGKSGAWVLGALKPEHWLLERYWMFSCAMLILAAPLLLVRGTRTDVLGIGVYAGLTAVTWGWAQRNRKQGALLHLVCMFPYWAWYSQLAGGLPALLGAGVAEFALLLVFPVLTLVAVEGGRGAATAAVVSLGCLVWRWTELEPRITGAFLLGSAVMVGLVFRRLATQLEAAHERLSHMAFHDALTQLPNRRALEQAATEALASDDGGALLFVDLDRFKNVNDVFGHSVGDGVLIDVAKRLNEAVPEKHVAARIGGDEFAVLLANTSLEVAVRVAERIVESLGEPFDSDERVLHIGASAGIATWPLDGHDLRTLMKCADLAMYRAKQNKLAVAVHEAERDDAALSKRGLELDLWQAIDDDQLVVHLQPVLNIHSDRIVGAEALVRWNHPERGLVSPASFIELAEQSGQVTAVDRVVLRKTLHHARMWLDAGWQGWVAVNFSARTLEQEDLVERVLEELDVAGVPPQRLVVELTESAAMVDPEKTLARLRALRDRGIRVALDDFGMGYSSLAYLKRFPADHIKIDRAFTRGIGKHPRDEEVIDLVLSLADKWNIEIIAEGVETIEQLDWLLGRGCARAQGYLIGRPMKPRAFMEQVLSTSVDLHGERVSFSGLRGTTSHPPASHEVPKLRSVSSMTLDGKRMSSGPVEPLDIEETS